MPNTFMISDTHFGHEKTWKEFKRPDGSPLRPFSSTEEMDDAMVDRWNYVVKPHDRVYHLGDVVINKKNLSTLSRLNGRKVLIKGNHDIFKLSDYTPYFDDIRAYKVFSDMVLSHIPLHEDSFHRFGINVHGHLHDRQVMKDGLPDNKYFSVCVERINFAPISIDEIRAWIKTVS